MRSRDLQVERSEPVSAKLAVDAALLAQPHLAEPAVYGLFYGSPSRVKADKHEDVFGDLDADWLLSEPSDWARDPRVRRRP